MPRRRIGPVRRFGPHLEPPAAARTENMAFCFRGRVVLSCATALSLLFVLAACEEDVTDGMATEHPYTLYGYLNPTADTQFVRVFAVEPTLNPKSGEAIDAVVSFQDLIGGGTVPARDSIVHFTNSGVGHVFWAVFRPNFGGRYRIDVRRSDGPSSYASTPIPPLIDTTPGAPYTEFRLQNERYVPLLPADLAGSEMRVLRLTARYEVELLNVGREIIDIPYLTVAERTAFGWHVEVNLREDFLTIFDALRNLRVQSGQDQIEFISLDLIPEVANLEWEPPGGVFDPDLLVEPGVFDNVENGFGFFGSAYRHPRRIPVNTCLQYIAGFNMPSVVCSSEQRCEYLEQCS